MIVTGALTYNAFSSFASTLNSNNPTKTLWSTSWLKSSSPLSGWFTFGYILITFNSVSFLGFVASLFAGDTSVVFYRVAQLALLYPVITVPFAILAYTNYNTCSSLSSSNFTGTSAAEATTTQYSSCTGGSSAEYGDSGTIAIKVNDDPYKTWFYVDLAAVLFQTAMTYGTYSSFSTYFNYIIDKPDGEAPENSKV